MITTKNYSKATNLSCKDAISKGISEGYEYDRGHLNTDFLKSVIEKYGYIRTGTILAIAIAGKKWDARISKANMEWAEKWEYVIDEPHRNELLLEKHNPGLIDILISKFRSLADTYYNPLPDTSVDYDEVYYYGYNIYNVGIYPLGEKKALELFGKDLPVLLLYTDDTEVYAESEEDIKKHCEDGGFCGIETDVWVDEVLFGAEKNKFYFTFGSDNGFPYQNTYLIVIAECIKEAVKKFQKKYPDRHNGVINCAFVYNEEQWNGSENQKAYSNEPVEIIE